MQRRDFVKALAGGTAMGLVMGQDATAKMMARMPSQGCSTNWQKAQTLMKEKQLPGLVIKIDENTQLKNKLQSCFHDDNKILLELMASHIVVCISQYYCTQIFKDMGAKNVAIISPDQKKKEYFDLPMDTSTRPNDIVVKLKQIAYGKDLERIKSRKLELSNSISDNDKIAIDKALLQLDAASYKDRRKGRIYLTQNLDKAFAALVICQYKSNSVEVVEGCKEILRSSASRDKASILGKSLLNPVVYNHYGVKCGMASMPEGSRLFISQL